MTRRSFLARAMAALAALSLPRLPAWPGGLLRTLAGRHQARL